jgi:alpha-1,3-rhamnosyl/mannosyltransferase
MRIVVNELQSLKQRTGIGHYTAELLCALRALAPDAVAGFPDGLLRRMTRAGFGADRRLHATPGTARKPGVIARWRRWASGHLRDRFQTLLERRFQQACTAEGYDLYHEPNFLPMPADCPTVATFHDLSLLRHRAWHPADRVARFERQLPAVLQRCAHLITDTEAVRRELIHDLGVAPERVTRVHIGVRADLGPLPPDTLAAGLKRLGLPSRYLLTVGTIEPRKNILRLLQAYCALPAALRSAWPLVLVGGWGWNAEEVAGYLHDEARHRGVLHLGYVDDADLPILYGGARALFFPSHYEGFGLPPLEMMACGGAVIASTAESVRETAGRQAHLLDPEDDAGWHRALFQAAVDDDWCQSLRRGAQAWARRFSWERCAAETFAVYHKAIGRTSQKQRAAG